MTPYSSRRRPRSSWGRWVDFETFLHTRNGMPPLIHAGLAHAQFETIHPFVDGNGRMGRLLITLLLIHHGVLARPLLYLSYYLNEHRQQYGDGLQRVRDEGAWEDWLRFFLRGVAEVAREATATAKEVLAMQALHGDLALTHTSAEIRGRVTLWTCS